MRLDTRFLGSRVARRIFWLFVLATLLPLAVSDWLSTSAIADLAHQLQSRSHAQSTRQTALQVFDRLLAAKATLGVVAAMPGHHADESALDAHTARAFVRVSRADASGGRPDPLVDAWARADHGTPGGPLPMLTEPRSQERFELRTLPVPRGAPRLLMGESAGGRLVAVGELRPDYVWSPLADAVVNSGWLVTDGRERVLAAQGDEGLIPADPAASRPTGASAATLPAGTVTTHRTRLFLGAEFGAGDWVFQQQKLAADVLWYGAPLNQWLALVAAATMLAAALLSLRQIQRTLVPLEALTAGTRRLAAGDSGARVAIAGSDEFAVLGASFNAMAVRIEDQFRALESLASIDRDVLSGTPIDVVAARVVAQLGAAHPRLAASIVWLDDEAPSALHRVSHAPADGSVGRSVLTLSVAQLDAFASSVDDRFGARASGLLHGIAPDAHAGDTWQALLPLRWNASTRAALILGAPGALDAATLKAIAELRDRLAVAFSASARVREMVWRASHDSLTGLANRHGLNEFVDALLGGADAARRAAILFVDLDNFKDANDSLGHEVGDQVLCEAAARLADCAPAGALLARQGGDEFVIVLPDADELAARTVAAGVVNRLGAPFAIGREMHGFGASVGVALAPAHGRARAELLRRADIAMYAAKSAGRGRFAVFDDALEAAAQRRLRLPGELRRAVENGELRAHYQPRVSALDGRVTSAEALVRWQHPERGLLMPDGFIELAEESDLIDAIGCFMLDDACSRMKAWQRRHPGLLRVSVNVSARQLLSGALPTQVRDTLARHGLDPAALELEVTESLLIDSGGDAREQLEELRRIGVSIALDDFGTGYSSMAMLRNLPIDVMKIDRAFVKDLHRESSALPITRAIATLAQAMGLHLVAEGVENETQASQLRGLGCHEFQGYLYSRPLAPAEFSRFCAAATASELAFSHG
ncbi:putative bifunctional diguanylate cyclase/phosphodiesterase [Piscinibacter koreensis]|uniref:EAL domain-containing protein n=1 Tax=Piscinibacter koreensis TaxID=2742824 RepID=A0A7Y6TW85_9BURK|nr:EAL domain-containing protein [Schlegelella koreensis]NUZ05778.1 EAL domain-containing protein [Schlegelella koreensis]